MRTLWKRYQNTNMELTIQFFNENDKRLKNMFIQDSFLPSFLLSVKPSQYLQFVFNNEYTLSCSFSDSNSANLPFSFLQYYKI